MDDSIFVDMVNALAHYEKEDKEREQTKKGKDKEDDKERKDNGSIKTEKPDKLLEDIKTERNPFPSIHIFNVNRTSDTNGQFNMQIGLPSCINFRQYPVCFLIKEGQKN